MKKLSTAISLLFFPFILVFGESVHLKDGSIINGTVKNVGPDKITVETESGTLEIDKAKVETVDYNRAPQAPPIVTIEKNNSTTPENTSQSQNPSNTTEKRDKQTNEFILKIGYDIGGSHDVSNGMVCANGYGCTSLDDGSESTENGLSISSDLFAYASNNIGLGAGITYQTPRKQKNFDGDFNFIPIYGAVKLRTTPDLSNNYFYGVLQLGYNGFYGDNDYTGTGGKLTGGLYAGLGGGMCFNNFIFEALYTENNGSAEQSVYIPSLFTYANITADIKYTKTTLNIGYRFSL